MNIYSVDFPNLFLDSKGVVPRILSHTISYLKNLGHEFINCTPNFISPNKKTGAFFLQTRHTSFHMASKSIGVSHAKCAKRP